MKLQEQILPAEKINLYLQVLLYTEKNPKDSSKNYIGKVMNKWIKKKDIYSL